MARSMQNERSISSDSESDESVASSGDETSKDDTNLRDVGPSTAGKGIILESFELDDNDERLLTHLETRPPAFDEETTSRIRAAVPFLSETERKEVRCLCYQSFINEIR